MKIVAAFLYYVVNKIFSRVGTENYCFGVILRLYNYPSHFVPCSFQHVHKSILRFQRVRQLPAFELSITVQCVYYQKTT